WEPRRLTAWPAACVQALPEDHQPLSQVVGPALGQRGGQEVPTNGLQLAPDLRSGTRATADDESSFDGRLQLEVRHCPACALQRSLDVTGLRRIVRFAANQPTEVIRGATVEPVACGKDAPTDARAPTDLLLL